MKHSLDSEKIQIYNQDLKKETRYRIQKSYSNSNSKTIFYEEVFEYMARFELDYLLINLFMEKNSVQIINYLNSQDIFNKININPTSQYLLNILNFCKSSKKIDESDMISFTLSEFMNSIKEIDLVDIKFIQERNNLMKKYVFHIKESLFFSEESLDYSFLLFTKIWNILPILSSPFNNTKAIIFYSFLYDCLNTLKNKEKSKFIAFFDRTEEKFKSLYCNLDYIPILDDKNSEDYKHGYISHRQKLQNLISSFKELEIISTEFSYSYLIKTYISTRKHIVRKKIKSVLEEKIIKLQYPTEDQLESIKNVLTSIDDEDFVRFLKLKLYLYEL